MLRAVRYLVAGGLVLVVDDSSPDGTAEIARQDRRASSARSRSSSGRRRTASAPPIGPVRLGPRAGLRGASSRWTATSPTILPPFPSSSRPVEDGADLVIGSRYVPGGSIPAWSTSRTPAQPLRQPLRECRCSVSVSRTRRRASASTAATLLRRDRPRPVRADGYGFQIEMTYRARRGGAVIVEVPIRFVDRVEGTSKMSSSTVTEALGLVTLWGFARLADLRRPVAPPGRCRRR